MSTVPDDIRNSNEGAHALSGEPGRNCLREKVNSASRKIESQLIMEALERHRWNRKQAAGALGISYRSLMYKMKNSNLRSNTPGRRPEPV